MATRGVTALITGANRGLGLEMVKQMAECDKGPAKLFACCRDPDGGGAKALQALAKKHPGVIVIVQLGKRSTHTVAREEEPFDL